MLRIESALIGSPPTHATPNPIAPREGKESTPRRHRAKCTQTNHCAGPRLPASLTVVPLRGSRVLPCLPTALLRLSPSPQTKPPADARSGIFSPSTVLGASCLARPRPSRLGPLPLPSLGPPVELVPVLPPSANALLLRAMSVSSSSFGPHLILHASPPQACGRRCPVLCKRTRML